MGLSFLSTDTVRAARQLLGWRLYSQVDGALTAGIIAETEAYLSDDAASHSYGGRTKRNAPMFGSSGTAYVYQIYGMHYCFNVVTAAEGVGEAVLIRSLLPIVGLKIMSQRRANQNTQADQVATKSSDFDLTNGPAKLVQALGITKALNGCCLIDLSVAGQVTDQQPLWLEPPTRQVPTNTITVTTRVGITKASDQPLRFVLSAQERTYQLVTAIPRGRVLVPDGRVKL